MADKTKTLCKKKDELKDSLSQYKKLVRGARFICKKCGRAARDEKLLCKPTELDS